MTERVVVGDRVAYESSYKTTDVVAGCYYCEFTSRGSERTTLRKARQHILENPMHFVTVRRVQSRSVSTREMTDWERGNAA